MGKQSREKKTSEKPEKSEDKKSEKASENKRNHVKPSKLRTEGVTELRYDRFSATSFANFERDLRLVAGTEYGDLFGCVVKGQLPPDNLPLPKSVDSMHDELVVPLKEKISVLQLIDERTDEQEIELQVLQYRLNKAEDEHAKLTQATKEMMNLSLQEAYKAEVKDIIATKKKRVHDSPKLYWLIRRNLSEESLDKLKEHLGARWEFSEEEQDPVALWKALKDTHTAYTTGNPFQDEHALRQAYSEMRMQHGETIVNLKLRFTTAIRAMASIGMDLPSDRAQAQDFLGKLDHRWSSLKAHLANEVALGRDTNPKTLFEAFQLASNWNVVQYNPTTGRQSTTFATHAAQIKSKSKTDKSESDLKNKGAGKEKEKPSEESKEQKKPNGPVCFICGDNHHKKDCPYQEEAKKYIEKLKSVNPSNSANNTDGTPASNSGNSRSHMTSTSRASFTTFVFSSNDNNGKEWLRNRILFDPQAQSSSFCNKKFITDIRERDTPLRLSGQVEGAMIIDKQANFMDMITVDYSPKLTTNIISGAEMKQVYGFRWEYDSIRDEFYLYIGSKTLTFKSENFLYTLDPTDDYEIMSVHATLMTQTQERNAKKASELMKRLGYPSPQRLITAIRDGSITNSGVSPEDVRRAEAIYGRPYPYLAGKNVCGGIRICHRQ